MKPARQRDYVCVITILWRGCEDIEDSPAQIHLRGHTVLRGAGEPHAQLLED